MVGCQVYIPAIAGRLPDDAVKAIVACVDFCYLVRRSVVDVSAIREVEEALDRLYEHRQFFITAGVRDTISLPRQHALLHYSRMIQLFGAPSGISTSITESKHKQVVKGTYTRTNKFKPLMQMLLLNERMDKMSAAKADFTRRGMMATPIQLLGADTAPLEPNDEDEDEEGIDELEESLFPSLDPQVQPAGEDSEGVRDDTDLLNEDDFEILRQPQAEDPPKRDDDSDAAGTGSGDECELESEDVQPTSDVFLGASRGQLSHSATALELKFTH